MQFSEVKFGDLDNIVFRLDADFYHPKYIQLENKLRNFELKTLREIECTIDCSAFYPSIVQFYDFEGIGVPFLRVNEIQNGLLAISEDTAFLPKSILEENSSTIAVCHPGDLVIAKGGNSLGKVALLTDEYPEYAICRDVLVVKTQNIVDVNKYFLWMYLHSEIGKSLLLRTASQTGQPHLTLEAIYQLEVPCLSKTFQGLFEEIYYESQKMRAKSNELYDLAQNKILTALDFYKDPPKHQLSYTMDYEQVSSSGRIDADFFQPKYAKLMEKLASSGKSEKLSCFLTQNKRGTQPSYSEDGLPVINSRHVRPCEVVLKGNRQAQVLKDKTLIIEKGDVLVNGTGVGTIGRCSAYLHESSAIPDNHVTVLKVKDICPVYLSVFLSSPFGQMQVDKYFHGSSGQIELYPSDISEFYVWAAPKNTQKGIRTKIEKCTELREKSTEILKAAEESISMSLDKGERPATKYLQSSI